MLADILTGRVIAVPETRELDVFSALLERRGASVWRCPLVSILDAPDPGPVLQWLRRFAAGDCDDLILLTGEGLRRLLGCIDAHEPTLRAAFLAALGRVRRITRGPKPARALRQLGLLPDIEADIPTTDGVIARLSRESLTGRRIGLQLYGTEPNRPLQDFLRQSGAHCLPVAPYVYANASADAAVQELLEAMTARRIDAIAFTSQAQVDRLFSMGDAVLTALAAIEVAAVGPVVSAALQQRGVRVDAMPQASWSMKPLATELCALLGDQVRDGTSAAETQ